MLESWKAFKVVFQQGVALFNQKPKKGIAYLQVWHGWVGVGVDGWWGGVRVLGGDGFSVAQW